MTLMEYSASHPEYEMSRCLLEMFGEEDTRPMEDCTGNDDVIDTGDGGFIISSN